MAVAAPSAAPKRHPVRQDGQREDCGQPAQPDDEPSPVSESKPLEAAQSIAREKADTRCKSLDR